MSEQGMPEVNAPKPRLLFVEDEATLREHLAERLSDEYIVDTAGNGNDALLAVMRAKPVLVVTDIVMPDMDGVELLKTLRQSPGTRSIPVLLISGRAPEAQRIEGFEEGADGFLAKPYTERELRALIRSMVRSAQLRTEAANFRNIGERKQIERDLQHALADLHAREVQLRENQRHLAAEAKSVRRLHELSQRTLNLMDRQVSHLVDLVDNLLDIGRIARGSVELKREKILLTNVLTSAVEASRPGIDAQAHKLVIDVRPTVPVIIDGDRHRLAQIFSNLLSNSTKYTDRGGTITLTLDCQGSDAVVSVRDTGIGIPPHALEQVFEMFSQVAPGDARSEGSLGIGLALVRTLTQLHDGSVSASSQGPGTGSVFTVRLPIMQEALAVSATGL
ncbi:MAG TPA: ATP-binding protein [Steroidobacteraceae bacterium]|nr:ATP-binding protein [Steroidobacteraceae bacterium]